LVTLPCGVNFFTFLTIQRFPPTLTTNSFEDPELFCSPPSQRKNRAVKRRNTVGDEHRKEPNCDFKDHSKCKKKPFRTQLLGVAISCSLLYDTLSSTVILYFWISQLAVLIKMLIVYLVYLCIGALAFSHMESDAETKRYRTTDNLTVITFQLRCKKATENAALSKNDFTTKVRE